jgi:hypothetical protein
MKKFTIILATAMLIAASSAPASAWHYRNYSYQHYDPGPAIALGMFSAMAGAIIASQPPPPAYAPYYRSPAYSYTPGPCPQWWDGYMWNYSCD